MTQRKAAVRAHVERLNAELAQVVDHLNQEDWHMTTTSEAWPIGYAVRHIASGYAAVMEWVAAGRAVQPHQADPEAIHAGNAAGLATYGAGAPEEVRALLQRRQQAVLDLIDELQERDLNVPALVGATGQQRTVEEVLTTLLQAHTRGHLDSIRATAEVSTT